MAISAVALLNKVAHALLAGLHAERHSQMALPHTRRTEEQDVIAALHVAASRQFPDLLGIDRRLELEVEALQGLLEREACHRDAHLMMLLGLRTDLQRKQFVEELGVGNFLFRRLLQACGEFVLYLIKPELVAVFAEAFELLVAV